MKLDVSKIIALATGIILITVCCLMQYDLNRIQKDETNLRKVISHVHHMIQLNKLFLVVGCIQYLSLIWNMFFPFSSDNHFVDSYYSNEIKVSQIVSIVLGFAILIVGFKYVHDSIQEVTINNLTKQIQTLAMFFYGYATLTFLIAQIPLLFTYCHRCKIDNQMKEFADVIGFDLNSQSENGITNNQFVNLFQKHLSQFQNPNSNVNDIPKVDCALTTKESDDAIHVQLKCVQAQNQWKHIIHEMERFIQPIKNNTNNQNKKTVNEVFLDLDNIKSFNSVRENVYTADELKDKLLIPVGATDEVMEYLQNLPNWNIAKHVSNL